MNNRRRRTCFTREWKKQRAARGGLLSESGLTKKELVHQLKQAEMALARCERIAIANQLTAAVMHEVNNPLEAIMNLLYLLEIEKQNSPQALEYLTVLKGQLGVLTHIARTTLSFHRDQSSPHAVDLVVVAQAALKLHFSKLATNNVQVRTRFADRAMGYVIASEILQVLSNLILNAMEALTATPEPALHVRVHRRRHGLHITIADNGPGIPEAVEAGLFKANVTGRRMGTGMGLWLSKSLVLKHGGRLRFRTWRSAGKSGTVFQAWFPHADAA